MSSRAGDTFPASLAYSEALRIDEACDRFEAAWRAGAEPQVEDFIDELTEPARSVLRDELHALERALRRSAEGSLPATPRPRVEGKDDETKLPATVDVSPTAHHRTGEGKHDPSAATRGTRFRILHPHAAGGLGEVFVARDEELNREVALKQIQTRHASNPESQARFLIEAEVTGGLEHPGIVPVYSLGRHPDSRPFYVMKFIRGETLKDAIDRFHKAANRNDRERTVEFCKLLRRFIDVCNTIAYAHSRGILHRDLKPANIMLGRFGETLVVDWGLAKPVGVAGETGRGPESPLWPASTSGSAETQPGTMMGTPQYMSPEQASGRLDQAGPASDVFSLGATLYCLLTGRPAFDGATANTVIDKVCRGEFPSPRTISSSIPAPLDAICVKAMAHRPEDRYPSASALADEIEHWLADEPVSAYHEPPLVRLARWSRRHRTLTASLGALLITAVVALSISTVLIGREQARKEAQRRLAELNFARARAAVDQMLTEVAEVELADVPQMQPVRRRLLEKARAFYVDFLKQDAGSSVRLEAGRAHIRLGEIAELLGDHPGAERAYRQGSGLLQVLAAESPTRADPQRDLARGEYDLGVLFKKANRFRESERFLRLAVARREQLAAAHPDDPGDRQSLADGHYQLGALAARLRGRHAQEEADYRAALRIQEVNIAATRDSPGSRRKLARYLNNLSILLKDTGRLREAEVDWREAIAIQHKFAESPQSPPGDRWQLARSLSNLAVLLKETGRTDEAETMYEDARKLQSALVADFPEIPDYRNDLAATIHNLGLLWSGIARSDAARDAFRAAIELRRNLTVDFPGIPEYTQKLAVTRLSLANALKETDPSMARAGYREAQAAQDKLAAEYPDVTEYQVSLGRTLYSLARLQVVQNDLAGAKESLERAIQCHRSALAADPTDRPAREFLRDDQGVLCLTLIRSGELDRSANAAEELTRIMPDAPDEWVRSAIFLVECATAATDKASSESFARRAVRQLHLAVERRLINQPASLDVKELGPIQNRQDFQMLREELANRSKIRSG
jgi:serine/threonine protein kinase/tetratricopeptide (TPR) repeat protein